MTEKINDVIAKEAERKAKKEFNLPLFFEWAKLIQRAVMVILTVALIFGLGNMTREINELGNEVANIRVIAVKAVEVAVETRTEVLKRVEEIQRDGIKFRFRLW